MVKDYLTVKIEGEHPMAGNKETYDIDLNPDQMAFLRATKVKYDIVDESKTMRIILDFIQTSPDIHATVFNQTRCLRCE